MYGRVIHGYKLAVLTARTKWNSIPQQGRLCREPQKLVPETAMVGALLARVRSLFQKLCGQADCSHHRAPEGCLHVSSVRTYWD